MEVLHITPHFGGGVGQVLRAILPELSAVGHSSSVASIEEINEQSQELLLQQDIPFRERLETNAHQLPDMVNGSDVIVVHWWNHPALLNLLSTFCLPSGRFVFWSHISGLTHPNGYSLNWLRAPEKFIFTTPLSHFAPEVEVAKQKYNKEFETVWSTSGIEGLAHHVLSQTERDLGLVYCGNLDFSKMHSDFFKIAHALFESTGQPIRVIGPLTREFESRLAITNSQHCILPLSFIPESEKINLLSRSKIFIYPLSETHYGTCDQTIQEALALGLPVVAFGNLMERQMLEGANAGIVATSTDHFISASTELWNDESRRQALGLNAVTHARQSFSLPHCVTKLDKIFKETLNTATKKPLNLEVTNDITAGEIFLDSLGFSRGIVEQFCEQTQKGCEPSANIEDLNREMIKQVLRNGANWTSPTKSSPFHWLKKFPKDELLKKICENLG